MQLTRKSKDAPAIRRRQPERSCVVCRIKQGKRDFVRVARLADGRVAVDLSGKGPGRGAYICRRQACWFDNGLAPRLGRALKLTLGAEDLAALTAFAASLPADEHRAPGDPG